MEKIFEFLMSFFSLWQEKNKEVDLITRSEFVAQETYREYIKVASLAFNNVGEVTVLLDDQPVYPKTAYIETADTSNQNVTKKVKITFDTANAYGENTGTLANCIILIQEKNGN